MKCLLSGKAAREDRATQTLFAALVKFQRQAKLPTLAGAQATVVWLVFKQLARVHPRFAADLAEACVAEALNGSGNNAFLEARAQLAREEWRQQ